MSKKNVSVKLDESIVETLDAEADEKGVTRSDHLREIVRQRHATEAVTEQLRDEQQQVEEKYKAKLRQKEQRITELERGIDTVHEQAEKAARQAIRRRDNGGSSLSREDLQEVIEEIDNRAEKRHEETIDHVEDIQYILTKVTKIQQTLKSNFENINTAHKNMVRRLSDSPHDDDGVLSKTRALISGREK